MTSRVTQKVLENNKSYLPCATSSLDPKVKQAEDLPLGSRSENIENNIRESGKGSGVEARSTIRSAFCSLIHRQDLHT